MNCESILTFHYEITKNKLSEMCLTPVLINYPAVSAVIVIEGSGDVET
jgi:hypothetical protein